MAPRLLAHVSLAAASVALAVQVWPHVTSIRKGEYPHGAAWEPRVKAILDVSRVAARGGPYLSVPAGQGFEPVDRRVNDLGYSALAYMWGRTLDRPLNRGTLMRLNLAVLVAALLALLAWAPPSSRLAASIVLILTPMPVAAYLSPDPLATHASLAVLGIALAAALPRRFSLWCYPLLGIVLFAMHKIRSAYALYAAAAVLVLALFGAALERSRMPLLRAAALLAVCIPLELVWRLPLAARSADPRVTQQETLWTHNVYIVLLEGIGYSPNRWGIKASDPWVATYLAERFQADPLDVGTPESERRSRIVYFELLRSDPLHLLSVYASRLPAAARDRSFGGLAGALLLLAAVPAAFHVSWRRPPADQALLLSAAAVTLCVLFQTVVLDPRLLYAYPLRVVTGLTLGFASALLIERALIWPPGTRPRSP